ncbi:MAG TPA: HAMP domain-containing sensor histidine kinase [Candidatus Binatia bacterium]|nr:HAMP domain-containing sensor histidine kinase [Candidatus Binatia bacterium]
MSTGPGPRRWGGGPPPWWPVDEPWPPSDRDWGRRRRATRRAAWHSGGAGRQGFFLQIGCAILVFLIVLTIAFTIAITLVGGILGLVGISSDARLGALVILGLGVAALVVLGRSLGRTAEPIGELIEASASVEEGDLTVRVRERGPAGVRQLVRSFNAMSARLEADAESRRTLMADITHELRTPLTVIQGNLEGVIDGVYPADPEHLGTILDETRTLGRLVDDLRTLALAERGALELRREPVDLVALVDDTVAAARAGADAGSVSLHVAPAPAGTTGPTVDADPTRVREVLGNLLANAIRHTPSGGTVTISVRGGATMATVAVTDTGPGIPPELLGHVFERFVREPGSSGTGLGLAIARDLVVAHGGTIEATSPPGAGTTVSFTLPIEDPASS